jgi:transcriptional regulator
MYVPSHFAMSAAETRSLLASITAADLITPTSQGLVATFLPLRYDADSGEHGALLGHVARNNEHWRSAGAADGNGSSGSDSQGSAADSLVIVRGPDAYVSPSFYAAKREHGRVVPTWNYVTAHVYGRLIVHDDVDWLRSLVTTLTEQHEAQFAQPWAVTDAPAGYIDGQLKAIVGIELRITRIEAKAKLSQNRSEADRIGVVAGLSEPGSAAMTARASMAAAVQSTLPDQMSEP